MTDINTIAAILSMFIAIGSILVGVGMAKAREQDLRIAQTELKSQLEAAIADRIRDMQSLQKEVFACREERLRQSSVYITRDQFEEAMNELRGDIKKLIQMVAGIGHYQRGEDI